MAVLVKFTKGLKMGERLGFILIIFLLLLQVEVQAVSLGTLVKNVRSQVMKGETAGFTILLWNSVNSSFPVKIRATQIPEGLTVVISPKEFMMNFSKPDYHSTESRVEYIDTPYGLMKTTPVDVLVKVSKSVPIGEYEFYVKLTAGGTNTGISTVFEKTFRFNMEVVNYMPVKITTTVQKIEEKTNPNINESNKEKITGMFSKVSGFPFLIFIICLMIGIFLFYWIIYKHE